MNGWNESGMGIEVFLLRLLEGAVFEAQYGGMRGAIRGLTIEPESKADGSSLKGVLQKQPSSVTFQAMRCAKQI